MNGQLDERMLARLVMIASITVLAGTLAYMWLVPVPTDKGIATKRRKMEFDAKLQTSKAKKQLAEVEQEIALRVWPRSADQVPPAALDTVTKTAEKHKLKLIAFRPQRTIDIEGFVQLPFAITLDGSFLEVQGFLRDLEAKSTRLAPTLVQLTSAEGNSDRVTANLTVMAFAPAEAASKTSTGTPSTNPAKPGSTQPKPKPEEKIG